jgi:YggT family protein
MAGQIGTFIVETVFSLFVYLLLARFHFQWLRVPFRNPIGEFLIACTNWIVLPVRRVVPGLGGLDLASLLLAWLVRALGLWVVAAIAGASPHVGAILAVAAVDLLRFSIHILIFAIILQVAFSWINPDAPMAPYFDLITRPFLRPLRKIIPPIGRVDLSPLVLLLVLYVLEIPLAHLRAAAALVAA